MQLCSCVSRNCSSRFQSCRVDDIFQRFLADDARDSNCPRLALSVFFHCRRRKRPIRRRTTTTTTSSCISIPRNLPPKCSNCPQPLRLCPLAEPLTGTQQVVAALAVRQSAPRRCHWSVVSRLLLDGHSFVRQRPLPSRLLCPCHGRTAPIRGISSAQCDCCLCAPPKSSQCCPPADNVIECLLFQNSNSERNRPKIGLLGYYSAGNSSLCSHRPLLNESKKRGNEH